MTVGFSVSPEVRVRYAETDKMGYAYYANYLVWFEVGRNAWMRSRGLPYKKLEEAGYILPVVEAQITYHAPARYDDSLVVKTWVTGMPRASVTFQYEVTRGGEQLGTGPIRRACSIG